MSTFTLYATDRVGVRQAVVDPYESCEIFARINDVSSWSLVLPTDTSAGQVFASDTFARLEIGVDDLIWRSGPMTRLERTVDVDGDWLRLDGVDDTVWLARRLAHPQPGTQQPPYSTTAYDVHTGAPSTVIGELVNVNAGPGAIYFRRVAGLTVPTPPVIGAAITVSARWDNLLTLLQGIARGAGLAFDVVDLKLEVYLPSNKGVVFSAGLETLAGWVLTAPAASANYAFVAGGGAGTARIIREIQTQSSIDTWGRAELFQDRRDTSDTAQLDQAGRDTLAGTVTPISVVFNPIDTDGQTFGRDWNLGDVATVQAGGLTVIDQIREIHVTLDDNGATVVPSVGAPTGDLALFRSLAGLDRRVRQLERI
jgi:Siphovirus ReqiPepy6 Gp37-like protein